MYSLYRFMSTTRPCLCPRLDVDPSHSHYPPPRTATLFWYIQSYYMPPHTTESLPVRDSYIGSLSSSMFAGMMLGAVGWGTCTPFSSSPDVALGLISPQVLIF